MTIKKQQLPKEVMPVIDFDSRWKELITKYGKDFIKFFFRPKLAVLNSVISFFNFSKKTIMKKITQSKLTIKNFDLLKVTKSQLKKWLGSIILLGVTLTLISSLLGRLTIVKQTKEKILKTFGKNKIK